ncbi:unnamed protein product [Urochloa decumbens]|uniref:Uncharacterized protein n=1 Tax=Urochloa decumbens TaxID=240449 RepID=A0ABC9CS90_9POAL
MHASASATGEKLLQAMIWIHAAVRLVEQWTPEVWAACCGIGAGHHLPEARIEGGKTGHVSSSFCFFLSLWSIAVVD